MTTDHLLQCRVTEQEKADFLAAVVREPRTWRDGKLNPSKVLRRFVREYIAADKKKSGTEVTS